jgi:hypothetical protein
MFTSQYNTQDIYPKIMSQRFFIAGEDINAIGKKLTHASIYISNGG